MTENRPTAPTIIKSIMRKDLTSYARNKLYLFLTVLSLALFAVIFWVIPDTVDEKITLAIAPPLQQVAEESMVELLSMGISPEQLEQLSELDLSETEEEGIEIVELESAEELKGVVSGVLKAYRVDDGTVVIHDPSLGRTIPDNAEIVTLNIGITFPENFIARIATGRESEVIIYSEASVPAELQGAMQSFVRELAYQFAGRDLPVTLPEEETIILGVDRMGEQISMQQRMRPIMALVILMMETLAMASLISTEILQRTVTALRVTPMKISHFLTAKTIFGTLLALGQGLLILALTGSFTSENWLLLTVTMLMGAMLFTGVAMIIGSAGKDFMNQLMYAIIYTVPLMIPAIAVLFPGSAAVWVKLIPSYPVVDLLVGVTMYDVGWSESGEALLFSAAWVAVLYILGLIVLKRKVETL